MSCSSKNHEENTFVIIISDHRHKVKLFCSALFKILSTLKKFIWLLRTLWSYIILTLFHIQFWFRIQVNQELTHKPKFFPSQRANLRAKHIIWQNCFLKNSLDAALCNIYGTLLRRMISSWYRKSDNVVEGQKLFSL